MTDTGVAERPKSTGAKSNNKPNKKSNKPANKKPKKKSAGKSKSKSVDVIPSTAKSSKAAGPIIFNTVQEVELAGIKVTAENKCDFCVQSICCTYITQELDKPRSMSDFDYILWLVSHEDVSVFKDEDGWFLSTNRRCLHLQTNGMCGIYDTRPEICREHSNDSCEFDGPAEEDFELYFPTYESVDKYCRKKFKKWDNRFKKFEKKRNKKDKKNKKDH